jgi:Fic family protein
MELQALLQKITEANAQIKTLTTAENHDFHAQNWENKLRLDWNYAANYLSGGTFSKAEIANLTDEKADYGLINNLKKYARKELYETISHDKIVLDILDGAYNKRKISLELILELHKLLLFEPENKQKRSLIGKWRNFDNQLVNYRAETIYFSHYNNIENEILLLLQDWEKYLIQKNENTTSIHLIEKIAQFQLDFLKIHPFYDGNGRIAHLLMNIMLHSFEYPIILIGETEKAEYERTLALAQGYKKMPQHFYVFVAQLILQNAQLKIRYLSGNYLLNKQAAFFSRLQQFKEKLSLEKEKIENGKENVNWQTHFLPFLRELFVHFEENTAQFSDLFFETQRKMSFFFLDSTQDWVHKELFLASDFDTLPAILSLNDCTFSYIGTHFRFHNSTPFSLSMEVLKVVFQPYSYQILCRKGEGLFVFCTYPYHKLPNEKEIEAIFTQIFEVILTKIEEGN